ncbi:MAG: hypothetical protein KH005_06990 [Clostridium sp.]|nr:hypothetical protein [Clostridium sp.]
MDFYLLQFNFTTSLFVIFIILGIFIFWFKYTTEFKVTNISQYTNPNNSYTILFQSVGEPFLFGSEEVKITLFDNKKKKVTIIHGDISNDGGRASESNIKIKWFNDYVEIILSGDEQKDEIYKIDYN